MNSSLVRFAAFALTAFVLSACAKREEARAPETTEPRKDEPLKPGPEPIKPGVPPKPEPPKPVPPKPQEPGKTPGKSKGPPGFGGLPLPKLSGLLPGSGGAPMPADPELTKKYTAALVGTWTADLGDGVTEELTYREDGTYTVALKGPAPQAATGKYSVSGPSGTRGLRLTVDSGGGPRTVHAVFEGEELVHPALVPGVTGTYRKKK